MKSLLDLINNSFEAKNMNISLSKEQLDVCFEIAEEEFEAIIENQNMKINFFNPIKKTWIRFYAFFLAKEILGIGIRGKFGSSFKNNNKNADKLIESSRLGQDTLRDTIKQYNEQ